MQRLDKKTAKLAKIAKDEEMLVKNDIKRFIQKKSSRILRCLRELRGFLADPLHKQYFAKKWVMASPLVTASLS